MTSCCYLDGEGVRCTNLASNEVVVHKDPEICDRTKSHPNYESWFVTLVCGDHKFNTTDYLDLKLDLALVDIPKYTAEDKCI